MPRKAKKPPEPEAGSPAWMTTFGDLMSLLLTFFVLIVSMSSIQESKFMVAVESFRRALSWFEGQPPRPLLNLKLKRSGADRAEEKVPVISTKEIYPIIAADDIIRIAQEMQTKVAELNIGGQVQVYYNSKEVRIYIEDAVMFENMSADIKGKEALHLLESIVELVEDIPYPLNIEGYTDRRLIGNDNGDYESHWELASARALAVLHYLNRSGVSAKRLKAVAYGANKPKVDEYCVPEDRWRNNRVEIVIRDTEAE
jgi:chemotaxis protein MotB